MRNSYLVSVPVKLTPYLEQLLATGAYGTTIEECIAELALEAIRVRMGELIELTKGDSSGKPRERSGKA